MDFLFGFLSKLAASKAVKLAAEEAENFNQPIDMPKNIQEYGFSQSLKSRGSAIAYEMNICHLFETFKKEIGEDANKQEELQLPLRQKKEEIISRIQYLKEKAERLQQITKAEIRKKIEDLRGDISEIRQNPEKIVTKPVSRVLFFILSVLLILVTAFLFVFYSSAFYSAFFRTFNPADIGVVMAVFNPDVFEKAWREGLMAFLFIILVPNVFISAGYILHFFIDHKKYWLLPLFLALAFILDVLMAYEITKKLYDLEVLKSYNDLPLYSIALALKSPAFWIIIMSGFFVYVVWGILFHFWTEYHRKNDLIGETIRTREIAITENEKRLLEIDTEIEDVKEDIHRQEKELKIIDTQLNTTLIDPKIFEQTIYGFTTGWIECIHVNRLNSELEQKVKDILEEFMNKNILISQQIIKR